MTGGETKQHAVFDALASEAYLQGRRAARERLPFAVNPYPDESFERRQWAEGWRSAAAELAYRDALECRA